MAKRILKGVTYVQYRTAWLVENGYVRRPKVKMARMLELTDKGKRALVVHGTKSPVDEAG